MLSYRGRLPHWVPDDTAIFVTWRLAGSSPPSRPEILTAENTCQTPFISQNKFAECSPAGPLWLRDPRIASMVDEALHYGEAGRGFYWLYAWVIMPNHVHVVFEPKAALPGIMRWLKGRTSRTANRILERTGMPFWQDESYDHWIRSGRELQEIIDYVEGNPVKAGLVDVEERWPWSSARLKADDTIRSSAPRGPGEI